VVQWVMCTRCVCVSEACVWDSHRLVSRVLCKGLLCRVCVVFMCDCGLHLWYRGTRSHQTVK
jgi:hypothetical protein